MSFIIEFLLSNAIILLYCGVLNGDNCFFGSGELHNISLPFLTNVEEPDSIAYLLFIIDVAPLSKYAYDSICDLSVKESGIRLLL